MHECRVLKILSFFLFIPINDKEERQCCSKISFENGSRLMRNLKKSLFIFISGLLLFPISALTYQGFNVEPTNFENDIIDGFVITEYSGSDEIVTVPNEIGGIPVVEIGNEAFKDNSNLTFVSVPENIRKIGENTFLGCKNLKVVKLSNNVSVISSGAFESCVSLEKIELPSNLKEINANLFSHCANLENVYIPSGIEKIDSRAFLDCPKISLIVDSKNEVYKTIQNGKGLISKDGKILVSYFGKNSSISIYANFTEIAENAFYENKNLRTIQIPSTIKKIGENAFYGCKNLQIVDIESIGEWNKIEFVNIYANPLNYAKSFRLNGNLVKGLAFGSSVTEIKDFAYSGYKGLLSVTFGENIVSIGKEAFADCTNLRTIKNLTDSIRIDSTSFRNVPGFTGFAENRAFNLEEDNAIDIDKSSDEAKPFVFYNEEFEAEEPDSSYENEIELEEPENSSPIEGKITRAEENSVSATTNATNDSDKDVISSAAFDEVNDIQKEVDPSSEDSVDETTFIYDRYKTPAADAK